MAASARAALPAIVSGLFGVAFFGWIAGAGVIDPRSVRWVFQGDWQWHFFGWQFFRNESWHLPPGQLTTYMEPVGSALGYTDSIPLAAFLLKPFAGWLPNPLQYLGAWMLVCFALQGAIGSVLVGAWTREPLLRTLGGCLLVLAPTLLARTMHPALCSHWALLWALWLAVREPPDASGGAHAHHFLVALVSGLLHPYLAVMVLSVLAAAAARRALVHPRFIPAAVPFALSLLGVALGWWASGLFVVSSTDPLSTEGWGRFSLNLLALVNSGERSRFLPGLPWIAPEQQHEGFHYLGLGLLLLCSVALCVVMLRHPLRKTAWPLAGVLAVLTAVALGPRVTVGDHVVADFTPYLGDSFTFRASARFFWPVAYALVAAALGVVAAAMRRRVSVALFAGALVLQIVDLQPWYTSLYHGFRNPVFLGAPLPVPSPEWGTLLPGFEHVRMYSTQMCGGPMPVAMAFAGYLAGVYGLGLNDGFAARSDSTRIAAACRRQRQELTDGALDDATVYFVASELLAAFQKGRSSRCHAIDGVPVCVSDAAARRLALAW